MWKTCQVKCGGLCRISLDGRPCLPVCMACGAVQVEASRRGGWMGFFYLHDKVVFCHWAGCGVESLMVFSFACPAARYSAKEARGRPRMALTGRRGEAAVDACCLRRSRGGAEISGFTSLGRNRRTDPKRTAHKKGEVIRKFGPWMDFWVLKGIRKIPVPKMSLTGTGSVFPRVRLDLMAWKLAYLFARCCSPAKNWKVLPFYPEETAPGDMDIWQVSFSETCKEALGLLAVQGSQERAEGKLMIDESC